MGESKLKKIGEINSYLFQENLVLAFSADWINVFGEKPKFIVLIDNDKLILQSQMFRQKKGDCNSC